MGEGFYLGHAKQGYQAALVLLTEAEISTLCISDHAPSVVCCLLRENHMAFVVCTPGEWMPVNLIIPNNNVDIPLPINNGLPTTYS